ncbi:Uncharacterised protein [Mycobacteroides abscessus subsp. abscessus]|nr:Uncharacterised protein [Mycobacteroides abscessus subsp. abscessus]
MFTRFRESSWTSSLVTAPASAKLPSGLLHLTLKMN